MLDRPSFLFFVTDQQRNDHVGFAGNRVVQTPHLDALARSGVSFSRAYVNNPLCMPARASLFAGLTPRGHGVRTNGIPLDPDLPTMPEALRQAGYRTHAAGKLHLGTFGLPRGESAEDVDPADFPECLDLWRSGVIDRLTRPYYGLESVDFVGGHGSGVAGDYLNWLRAEHPEAVRLLSREAGEPLASGAEQSWKMALPAELHFDTWIADRAISFLEEQAEAGDGDAARPFFLWCSFPDPHHPYCPPRPWADMYSAAEVELPTRREGELDDLPPHYRDIYERPVQLSGRSRPTRIADDQIRDIVALTYGMISFVDSQVGRVMAALERLGLRESTVVGFLSDHGDMMGDHWMLNKGPFHFDGLLKVPLVWSWPGHFPADTRTSALASHLDVPLTVLDLAGVPVPEGRAPAEPEAPRTLPPWPGTSLAPVLTGQTASVQESLVVENDEDYLGLRLRTLVTERYQITAYPGQPYGELFDLAEDPRQLHNLWDRPEYADVRRDLLVRLLERLVQTDSTLPRRLCHA